MKKSIVTKKGDNGKTYMPAFGNIAKDDIRIEFVGVLDELSSFMGYAKSKIKDEKIKNILHELQKDLILVGAELSLQKNNITAEKVKKIEEYIENLYEKVEISPKFELSGKNEKSALIDICRTIARRLERRLVKLYENDFLKNKQTLAYVNRISDLLFLMSKSLE